MPIKLRLKEMLDNDAEKLIKNPKFSNTEEGNWFLNILHSLVEPYKLYAKGIKRGLTSEEFETLAIANIGDIGPTPIGIVAGAKATGFKSAKRTFSALWDKKPRFDISAKGYKIKKSFVELRDLADGRKVNLDEIIDFPELFKNYPEFRKVKVKPFLGKGGAYSPGGNYLELGILSGSDGTERVMMHEIQHLIQHVEGFAKGGNVETMTYELSRIVRETGMVLDATEAYMRLAGEAEARDAMLRSLMSESVKSRTQQLSYVGYRLKDLIVRGVK